MRHQTFENIAEVQVVGVGRNGENGLRAVAGQGQIRYPFKHVSLKKVNLLSQTSLQVARVVSIEKLFIHTPRNAKIYTNRTTGRLAAPANGPSKLKGMQMNA